MVERPIKKSERQIAQPTDVIEQVPEAEPSQTEGSQKSITETPQKRVKPNDVIEQVPEAEPSQTEGSQESITETPQKRVITLPPVQGKEKTKGKGRGNQQDEDRSKLANPALMRGPKPTKSKPPLIKKTEEETEVGQEETTED